VGDSLSRSTCGEWSYLIFNFHFKISIYLGIPILLSPVEERLGNVKAGCRSDKHCQREKGGNGNTIPSSEAGDYHGINMLVTNVRSRFEC